MGDRAIDERKKESRVRFKQVRAAIPEKERRQMDAAIAERFLALPEYAEAAVVFTYLSIADEVDTRAIIARAWTDGKTVALPRCVPHSREMDWLRATSFDEMETSAFGVEEPPYRQEDILRPEDAMRSIAIVPGLTFDLEGFRMGYGGGFYDTFLAKFGGISIGLCREAQVSESVEALGLRDAHDHAADIVVTDARVLRPSAGVHLQP